MNILTCFSTLRASRVAVVFLASALLAMSAACASSPTVRGDVSDDRTVRDFYVVLQNRLDERTTQSLKRAYQYVGVPSTTIAEDIPLQPGMNRITVVARDDERATSSEVIYVYRHD